MRTGIMLLTLHNRTRITRIFICFNYVFPDINARWSKLYQFLNKSSIKFFSEEWQFRR